jgi:hypothetical protein
MSKFFTGLTAVLLLAVAAALASRLVLPWDLVIEGSSVAPILGLIVAGVLAVLAIAVLLEMRTGAGGLESAATRSATTRSMQTRAPLSFTVRQGKRYRADIRLSWWEQSLATNEYIAGQLASVGFTDVSVQGTGAQRTAEGLWPHPDQTAEMPPQIVAAAEIAEPNEPAGTVTTVASNQN